jgi:type IV secretion system protein VirB9
MITRQSFIAKRRLLVVVLMGVLGASRAAAPPDPGSGPASQANRGVPVGQDPRIRHVLYTGEVAVELRVGRYPTLIELRPEEAIVDVACDGNETTPRTWNLVWRVGRSYIFIEPRVGAEAAGLTIKTTQHSYVFDLVPDLLASLFDPARTAKLVVELPESPTQLKEHSAALAVEERERNNQPVRRNDRYSLEVVHEVEDVRPREVFDDGRFTYMRFPNNLPIPAIYLGTVGASSERLINSHMEGDYVVLEGLATLWNLRFGGSLLGVFNERFEVEGVPPVDGSTVPGVTRVSVRTDR